jgi:hypothetical protein
LRQLLLRLLLLRLLLLRLLLLQRLAGRLLRGLQGAAAWRSLLHAAVSPTHAARHLQAASSQVTAWLQGLTMPLHARQHAHHSCLCYSQTHRTQNR